MMEKDKGTLRVYVEQDQDKLDVFVVERVNPFNHSFKSSYLTEDGLREGLESYKQIAKQLDLEVQKNVFLENGEMLLQRVVYILHDKGGLV